MTCGFVTIELRPLTYVQLTNRSVTYVSGTCVTLDSGLNKGGARGGRGSSFFIQVAVTN